MRRIFSKLLYEIEEERNIMLVTVIADRGSAPRGAGAAMLVGEKGRITGTIGGGAVEYQSEKKAMELLKAGESAVHEFVLRPNDKEDIGMQCGGDVTVLFEYVSADDLRWSLLAGAVCDRIEAGKHGWLVLPLDGSVPSLYGEEGLLCGEGVSEEERAALHDAYGRHKHLLRRTAAALQPCCDLRRRPHHAGAHTHARRGGFPLRRAR